jgi:hypothetical protein
MLNKVKIGGIVYSINIVDKLLSDDNTKLDGQISYTNSEINLDSRLSEQTRYQILWHEILHGILTHAGNTELIGEEDINVLAYSIMQILRDNPKLFDAIKELDA